MTEIKERIYDVWARRTPKFEKHYEQTVLRELSDYGHGTTEVSEAKGKILGAGYEPLIMAFFIGLYSNKKLTLSVTEETKILGQPIMYWGNLDSKKLRKAYPRLRSYIFMALVARTNDIDWIALEKGEIAVNSVVSQLMDTMEQYINYGLCVMEEKMKMDSAYFYGPMPFLAMFQELTQPKKAPDVSDQPEEL